MGTRGFGDSSSKEKKELKEKRAKETTSATLGVRLCGMQVIHFFFFFFFFFFYILYYIRENKSYKDTP